MEALFFWIFSIGMLLGGLSVIVNRSPIASALSLVISIGCMAGLYLLLNAFFLAAIQIIVYAGAVMVLFLFIIMLLDLKAEEKRTVRLVSLLSGMLLSGLFLLAVVRVGRASVIKEGFTGVGPAIINDVALIGRELFTRYLLPFEVTSVLLLVATVGVVLLSKKEMKS